MAMFEMPVRLYMTRNVHTVGRSTPAEDVWQHMWDRRISAVPVVDDGGKPVGVISRTDLIREGKVNYPTGSSRPALELPTKTAGTLMLGVFETVGPDDTIAAAAKKMCDKHIHRVYVQRGGELTGVLTVRDVMQAVVDKRPDGTIADLMTHEVHTVPMDATLARVTEMLATGGMTGVIVVDRGWPAGAISQEEVLLARHRSPDTHAERVMTEALVALPPHTPVHRAAAHAISMHVRRIVVMGKTAMAGIVSGLDLVRVAASS